MPALPVSITIQIWHSLTITGQHYDSKTKINVFYSFSNAFDLTSGSTLETIDPNILK